MGRSPPHAWGLRREPPTRTAEYIYKHLELTAQDLLRKASRIYAREKSVPVLTDAELDRLLESLDRPTYTDVRNRAFLFLPVGTGQRFEEALSINMADIDRVSWRIRVVGKGNKERWVGMSPTAAREVKAYLRRRPNGGSDRLLLTEGGRPLSYGGGQSVFQRLKARSGLDHIHPHTLRHNFAKKTLEKGVDRAVLMDMLGHTTPAMTNRYLGDERKTHAAKEMPRFSPI